LAHVSSLNPSSKGKSTLIGRESNISSKSTNKRYHQQHAEESKAKQRKDDFLMNRQQVRNTHTGGKTEQTIKGANQGFKERERKEEEQEKEEEDLPLTNTLGPHYRLRQRIEFLLAVSGK
jgi:hypothetical protein